MFTEVECVWSKNWHTNTARAMEQSGAWSNIRMEFISNENDERKIIFKIDKVLIDKTEEYLKTNFHEDLNWKVIDNLMNVMVFRVMELENAQFELDKYKLRDLARAFKYNETEKGYSVKYVSPKFKKRGCISNQKKVKVKDYFQLY